MLYDNFNEEQQTMLKRLNVNCNYLIYGNKNSGKSFWATGIESIFNGHVALLASTREYAVNETNGAVSIADFMEYDYDDWWTNDNFSEALKNKIDTALYIIIDGAQELTEMQFNAFSKTLDRVVNEIKCKMPQIVLLCDVEDNELTYGALPCMKSIAWGNMVFSYVNFKSNISSNLNTLCKSQYEGIPEILLNRRVLVPFHGLVDKEKLPPNHFTIDAITYKGHSFGGFDSTILPVEEHVQLKVGDSVEILCDDKNYLNDELNFKKGEVGSVTGISPINQVCQCLFI